MDDVGVDRSLLSGGERLDAFMIYGPACYQCSPCHLEYLNGPLEVFPLFKAYLSNSPLYLEGCGIRWSPGLDRITYRVRHRLGGGDRGGPRVPVGSPRILVECCSVPSSGSWEVSWMSMRRVVLPLSGG